MLSKSKLQGTPFPTGDSKSVKVVETGLESKLVTLTIKPNVATIATTPVLNSVSKTISTAPMRIPLTKALAPKASAKALAKQKAAIVPQELVLQPHLIEWANKIIHILNDHHGYFDSSPENSMVTAIHTALKYGLSLTVICSAGATSLLENTAAMYGAELACVTSYDGLRSSRNKQSSSGLLCREDKLTETGKHKL